MIWSEGWSQVTRAKATVPDRLIWAAPPGPYGLATLSTPGTAAALASAAVTAVWTGADRMAAPLVAWITTWSLSPDCGREVRGQQGSRRLRVGIRAG